MNWISYIIFDYFRHLYVQKLDDRHAWLYRENFKILQYNHGVVERNVHNACLLLKYFDNGGRVMQNSHKNFSRKINWWQFIVSESELQLAIDYFYEEVKKTNDTLIEISKNNMPKDLESFRFEDFKRFVDWTYYCVDDRDPADIATDLYLENVEIFKQNAEAILNMSTAANSQDMFMKEIKTIVSSYDEKVKYRCNPKIILKMTNKFIYNANKYMRYIQSNLPEGYRSLKFTPFVNQKTLVSRY